jgi:hypothetical protein
LRAIGISKRRVQLRAKHLEIYRRPEGIELVAKIAQPLQPLIDIEKSRLAAHRIISTVCHDGIGKTASWRDFENGPA